MSRFTIQPTRTRFAALGLAAMTTLGMLTGLGTLAQTQVADAEFVASMTSTDAERLVQLPGVQQVVVIGQRTPAVQKVVVTSQRAPRS
jgi:hypothetical protein